VTQPSSCADCAFHAWFVLGPEVPAWRGLDLAQQPVRALKRDMVVAEGSGANALGDPRIALAWLANHLNSRGLALKAGEISATGSLSGHTDLLLDANEGDREFLEETKETFEKMGRVIQSSTKILPGDSGGPLDFVRHEETGLVTDPVPEALAGAMAALADDAALAERLGQRGRATVSGLTWANTLARLLIV